MTIITSVPPPETPGAAARVPIGAAGAVPGPLRFIGRALRTLWSNGKARAGLIILGVIILVAVFAPVLAPHSPTATTFPPYLGPNHVNWLGTTGNGQDVFSQLIYGARISLIVGICAGALATLVAVTVGLISGYRPGPVDEGLSFVTNLALVIPALPLMIILAAYLQGHSVWTIVLVVAFTSWATGARVMRSQVSTLRTREFVTSAVFSGAFTDPVDPTRTSFAVDPGSAVDWVDPDPPFQPPSPDPPQSCPRPGGSRGAHASQRA